MTRFLGIALLGACAAAAPRAGAGESEAKAVVDRGIQALGGGEKLGKVKAYFTAAKGTVTFNGGEVTFEGKTTTQGLDRMRSEFEGEAGGNAFKGVTVVRGDKAWRKFGDNAETLEGDALANAKRVVYLRAAPALLVPLKGPGFKLDTAPDETVADRPAAVVKVTGPDGKDFTLAFDKESGLPVRLTAKVLDFQGEEYNEVTTYDIYKDFGGIKHPTKSVVKRNGDPFIESETTDFKPLDKVEDDAFAEPQ